MNPERWQKISEVFEAALQADPERRELVLQQACAGDPGLRAEVEQLLAYDAAVRAEGFLSFLDAKVAAGVMARLQANVTGPGPSHNGTHVLDSIAATIVNCPGKCHHS